MIMKRKYIKPLTCQDEATICTMLATSINSISSSKGIGFGGADNEGNRDADVKELAFWYDDFFE